MFTFIPPLLSADHLGREYFEDLFSAVSIAAFSTRPNAAQAALAATTYYSRGVTKLRKALEDEDHAKSDTALASTILLGFYEVSRPEEEYVVLMAMLSLGAGSRGRGCWYRRVQSSF